MNGAAIMKAPGASLILVLSSITVPLGAVDFDTVGEVEASASYSRFAGPAEPIDRPAAELRLSARHTLTADRAEVSAVHTLILDPSGLRVDMQQAYVRWLPGGGLALTAGLLVKEWGDGVFFSPANVFLGAVTEPRVGVPGLLLEYEPSSSVGLTAGVNIADALVGGDGWYRDFRWLAMARFFLRGVEAIASYVHEADRFARPGLAVSADIAGFIVSAEATYDFSAPGARTEDKGLFDGVLRVTRTFALGRLSLGFGAEYAYDSGAYTREEWESYLAAAASGTAPGAPAASSPHRLGVLASADFDGTVQLDNAASLDLRDGNGFAVHGLTVGVSDSVAVFGEVRWWFGRDFADRPPDGTRFVAKAGLKVSF